MSKIANPLILCYLKRAWKGLHLLHSNLKKPYTSVTGKDPAGINREMILILIC